MEDDENQDIFVDLKNYNCKKCSKFPEESTIYICQNKINGKECGFTYCSFCVNNLKECLNCGSNKNKIKENHSISRLLKNAKKINTCSYCGGNFETQEDLNNHISSCRSAKYSCKFCNFCENDMDKFWEHLTKNHKSEVVKTLDENNN